MVASGDWITPRLNGFKYFEKPPLQYWATAVFYKAIGMKDWTARLWAALMGFAGILLVLGAGNRLFGPPAGAFAAAVLAASPVYVAAAQVNTLDMGLAFFLSGAVFALSLGYPIAFWACCAFAVLSKGLVGIVLPLATLGLYVLLKRDWKLIWEVRPISGPIVFLLIAAPWFVAVSLRNPEFAHFFFIQEHFQRFTTEDASPHRAGLVLPAGARARLRPPPAAGARWRGGAGCAVPRPPSTRCSGSRSGRWSCSPSSPLPARSCRRTSCRCSRRSRCSPAAISRKRTRALAARAGARSSRRSASPRRPSFPGAAAPPTPRYVPWLAAAGAVAAVLGILSLWKKISIFALAQPAFSPPSSRSSATARSPSASAPPRSSPRSSRSRRAGAPVYAVDIYDHSLPWYLRRPVTMVAYRDEFGAAIDWDKDKFIPDIATFERVWRAQKEAYAFVGVGQFDALASACR